MHVRLSILMAAAASLILAATATAETRVVELFPIKDQSAFEYVYGTWEQGNAVSSRIGIGVEIMPPANDSGGGGDVLPTMLAIPPEAILRVTLRLGDQNAADAFNIVLKDQDVEGVEDHVYRFATASFSTNEERTVGMPLAQSSSINNVKNGRPDFEKGNGLVAWEIQGTFEKYAHIHLLLKKIEIVLP